MARIRSVHPGLWTDEAFVQVSGMARLLAIGLWNECDDGGGFEWKPVQLKMRLLPADNADVAALLAELEGADIVRRYVIDGRAYGAVRNFGKFQSPKKPRRTHPMPASMRAYAATTDLSEGNASEPEPTESERDEDKRPTSSEPVGNQWGTSGEKSRQMEKEREKEKEDSEANASGAAAPPPQLPDIKAALFGEGRERLKRLTGQSDDTARSNIGRWLRLTHDDCAAVLDAIHAADEAQPAAPMAWLQRAVEKRAAAPARQPPRSPKPSLNERVLRAAGLWPPPDDEPPIVDLETLADRGLLQ